MQNIASMKPNGPSSDNEDSIKPDKAYNNIITIAKKEANALANINFLKTSHEEDLIPKTYRTNNKKHLKIGKAGNIKKMEATNKWIEL